MYSHRLDFVFLACRHSGTIPGRHCRRLALRPQTLPTPFPSSHPRVPCCLKAGGVFILPTNRSWGPAAPAVERGTELTATGPGRRISGDGFSLAVEAGYSFPRNPVNYRRKVAVGWGGPLIKAWAKGSLGPRLQRGVVSPTRAGARGGWWVPQGHVLGRPPHGGCWRAPRHRSSRAFPAAPHPAWRDRTGPGRAAPSHSGAAQMGGQGRSQAGGRGAGSAPRVARQHLAPRGPAGTSDRARAVALPGPAQPRRDPRRTGRDGTPPPRRWGAIAALALPLVPGPGAFPCAPGQRAAALGAGTCEGSRAPLLPPACARPGPARGAQLPPRCRAGLDPAPARALPAGPGSRHPRWRQRALGAALRAGAARPDGCSASRCPSRSSQAGLGAEEKSGLGQREGADWGRAEVKCFPGHQPSPWRALATHFLLLSHRPPSQLLEMSWD